jgi:hypothetical protein
MSTRTVALHAHTHLAHKRARGNAFRHKCKKTAHARVYTRAVRYAFTNTPGHRHTHTHGRTHARAQTQMGTHTRHRHKHTHTHTHTRTHARTNSCREKCSAYLHEQPHGQNRTHIISYPTTERQRQSDKLDRLRAWLRGCIWITDYPSTPQPPESPEYNRVRQVPLSIPLGTCFVPLGYR